MGLSSQTVASPELTATSLDAGSGGNPGPVRLLLITDTDLAMRGGSERFLAHLLDGLDPAQFEIDVIQLDWSPASHTRHEQADPAQPRKDKWCIEYRPVGAIYTLSAWKVWREVRARVRAGKYDVIQSQHEKADLLNALLPDGSCRHLRISNRRDTGFQKSRALRLLFLLINHRYDRIVAPSQAILDQLVQHEGVDRLKTRCLPNGVDCERFRPIDSDLRSQARRQFGLPEQAYLIGCVARLVPVKRHEDLIAGFSMIATSHPDARLVLVGGGMLGQSLERQVETLGLGRQVLFLGESRAMEQLLPLLDAFALVSSTEGMSNAILEAMACGLPTVATDVGGNPELVQPTVTGYLVPPFRPGELALALSELLEHREHGRRMGHAARRRAETVFSLPTMIDAFSTFYQSVRPEVTA